MMEPGFHRGYDETQCWDIQTLCSLVEELCPYNNNNFPLKDSLILKDMRNFKLLR